MKIYRSKFIDMIRSFENFKLLESKDQVLEKGLEILGAESAVEYYVLDVPNLPKVMQNTVFIYIPKVKLFGMCDRKENLSSKDFVSLSKIDIRELDFTTTNPLLIANYIKLVHSAEKGLSKEAFKWLEDEILTEEDFPWDAAVNRYLTTVKEVKDSDYKALGKKKEDYVTRRTSYKYGL